MFNYENYKVYLCCGKTDMRKSINGLCEIVQHNFELDPREKIIFGFCNNQRNRVKLLVWDDNGKSNQRSNFLAILHKRVKLGRFAPVVHTFRTYAKKLFIFVLFLRILDTLQTTRKRYSGLA